MEPQERPVDLPETLRRYFWEFAPDRLAWPRDRETIVGKLLESGGWDAVQWLRGCLSDGELSEFVVRRGGRGLSLKRLRFWGLILGLPREQVDEWVAAAGADPWLHRTHA